MSATTFEPNNGRPEPLAHQPGLDTSRSSAGSSTSDISGIWKMAIACALFLSNGAAGQPLNDTSPMISRNYAPLQLQVDCPDQFKQLAIAPVPVESTIPDEPASLEKLIEVLQSGTPEEVVHFLKNNRDHLLSMLRDEDIIQLIYDYSQFAEHFIDALQLHLNAANLPAILWGLGNIPRSKSLIQCLARNYYPEASQNIELQTIEKIVNFGGAVAAAEFMLPHLVHYHNLGVIGTLAELSGSDSVMFWGYLHQEARLDSRFFNIPDRNGNTLIHKFIRAGAIEFAKRLIQDIPQEELFLGHFSQEDLMACRVTETHGVNVGSLHNEMIAQKGCHAVLLQQDGSVVSIPGQEASQLYQNTMNGQENMDAFRIYLNPGHASIRLPSGHYGFYLTGEITTPLQLFQQHQCTILNDAHHAGISDQSNQLVLTVYASHQQIEAMQRYIEETARACQLGTMSYHALRMNCIDFVQKTVEAAGITANFRNAFQNTDYFQKPGVAPFYAMIRSKGPTFTFPSSAESATTQILNTIPRRESFAGLSCAVVGLVGRIFIGSVRCGGRGIAKIAYGVSRVWSAFRG